MEFIKTHKIYSAVIILSSIGYIRDREDYFALPLLILTILIGLIYFLDIKHKYRVIINSSIWILGVVVFIAKIYINQQYLPNLPTFNTGDGIIPDTRGSDLPFLIIFLIDNSLGLAFVFLILGGTNYTKLNDKEENFKPLNIKQQKEFFIIIGTAISLLLINTAYMLY